MGSLASRAAGVRTVVCSDALAAMGVTDVVARWRQVRRAYQQLQLQAQSARPTVAFLAGFTEFHARLGRWLRAQGARVLWCGAPQVWAWRAGRLRKLHDCLDRLAVLLPFEQALWVNQGYHARYVGHPAVDSTRWPQTDPGARRSLAVLCGSRDDEVRRIGPVLIQSASMFLDRHAGWKAQALVSPALSEARRFELETIALRAGLPCAVADPIEGAAGALHEHALALCTSGTACLEAALSGAIPVVAYRVDWLTALAARALVKTRFIGLPNVVLGEGVFPEVLQGELHASRLLQQAESALMRRQQLTEACSRLRRTMTLQDGMGFGERVALMMRDWL
jgi:lipid-A-disaccharide synthase